MHNHHSMAGQVLAPHQTNSQWPAANRELSPVPPAFFKKESSQFVVAAPTDGHQAGASSFQQTSILMQGLAGNKENSYFKASTADPKPVQDSPKRISKSKTSFSQNNSKYMSPKNQFEADSMLSIRNENVDRHGSNLTYQTSWNSSASRSPLRFKFKVYPTKIEKCQIDDLGNEIPGGIIELVQTKAVPCPRSERIRVNNMILPPGVKLVSSKYINLPLPRESQEKLSENIARYNTIIDQQYYLASQLGQNENVLHQLQHAEDQRVALANDQIQLLSQFMPSEQLWSQMMGDEHMASIPMLEHPAKLIKTSGVATTSKNQSLVSPVNMANILAVPSQELKHCSPAPAHIVSPNIFESLLHNHGDGTQAKVHHQASTVAGPDIFANQSELNRNHYNSYWQAYDNMGQTSGVVCTQVETDRDGYGSSGLKEADATKRISNERYDNSRTRPDNVENGIGFSSSEVSHLIIKGDKPDRGLAMASMDFNDWIEKGLFRQIHTLISAQERSSTIDKRATILSLIAEVPEEKSESSPIKGYSSAQKESFSNHGLNDEAAKNTSNTPMTLNKSKSVHNKESNFYTASNYPQEHMEVGLSKRSMSYEALEELARGGGPSTFDNRSMVPVPIFTSRKTSGENIDENGEYSQTTTPVKIMGAVYVSSNPTRPSYQGPHYSSYVIKEVNMEEEEEVPQDMRIKEMTPSKSGDFKAHRINTDCSPSVSGNDHSQILQGANFNVVFPSLRFSSAKLDKSIQVRTSINVTEGQSLKFECNNFIYLDQNEPATSNINAYMIQPINFCGMKKSHLMLDEAVQTEGVSPFIATQIVQELLKSKDFATEIKNADPNQGFTVTVTQDQEKNDFVIDVQMSSDMDNDNVDLAAKLDRIETLTTGMRALTDRNSLGDMDHQLKIVSKTESIKEMSELGHTSHLLNFDFAKKEMFGQTQKLAFDQHVGIKTITENEEQENSPGRSNSLEDDQVTIDNPLMKEYDATSSPDKHARTSRLESTLR